MGGMVTIRTSIPVTIFHPLDRSKGVSGLVMAGNLGKRIKAMVTRGRMRYDYKNNRTISFLNYYDIHIPLQFAALTQ